MKFFFTGPVCPAGTSMPFRQRHRFLIFLMRVSCTYIVLMILSLQVLLANKGRGQNLDQINVTVGLQNQNLQTLFKEIQLQTGLTFAFNTKDVDNAPAVSLPRATRSVKSTLDMALVGTRLRYEQVAQNVIISRGNIDVATIDGPYTAFSVRGKITDSKGEGIPGVSVFVKGTGRGTTSDADGVYTISVEANDVLVFSSIGFKSKEVAVEARGVIDVGMEDDVNSLQEVVVNAGYYDVKQREMTGNISRITAEEIQKQPVINPLSALQGRVPGMYIQQQTGLPGGNFTVRIRGQNSLREEGNEPLYIIDGIPFTSNSLSSPETSEELYGSGTSPLNGININDIESIEILKDADATAIYGSRGANGVILITTKRAKAGKTKVDVKFYNGVSKIVRKADLLSTPEYLEMRNEAFTNDKKNPGAFDYDVNGTWDKNRQTDWQKVLIGNTAHTNDFQLSISGGETNTQFSISGNYHKETVPFPGENVDNRLSIHLNLSNTSANQKLKTNLSTSFTSNFTDLIKHDLTREARMLPPNAPSLYDENGELNWENSTWENPLSYLKTSYEATNNTLIANLTLQYELLPRLLLKANIGYTNTQNKATTLTPKSFYSPENQPFYPNASAFSNTNFKNWIAEPQLSWKSQIGSGQIDLLIGASLLNQDNDRNVQTAFGFSSEALMKNIQAATSVASTNNYTQYRYNAIFGRINYSLAGKYLINVTGRRDGSSRFGPGRQFANFGAIGSAWIFSEENFIKDNLTFISFGKLRASYGITGNDQIGDYIYLDTYSPSTLYHTIVGLEPTRLSNPEFAWETNRKIEAGLELGVLQDRIRIETSYYYNQSSNQLVGTPLPPTTGFTFIQSNFPATIRNTGLEIVVNTVNTTNTYFNWTTSFNITIPHNKLVEFANLEKSEYASKYVVGEPLSILKRYHYLGLNPSSGLYQVQDINEDGLFNAQDQTSIKFKGQRYYGGLQNTIRCKGFELGFLLQFVKQTGYDYRFYNGTTPGRYGNQLKEVLNRWKQEGDDATSQLFSTTSTASTQHSRFTRSDAAIVDASFLRLKNVSISYTFPKEWIKRARIENLKIFLQGQNIITITDYEGLDPEFGANLPPMKVLTAGLYLTL